MSVRMRPGARAGPSLELWQRPRPRIGLRARLSILGLSSSEILPICRGFFGSRFRCSSCSKASLLVDRVSLNSSRRRFRSVKTKRFSCRKGDAGVSLSANDTTMCVGSNFQPNSDCLVTVCTVCVTCFRCTCLHVPLPVCYHGGSWGWGQVWI